MKTIKIIFILLLIFVYLLLNYSSLLFEMLVDKKLDNGDSVSTLAKDIAKDASCTLDIGGGLVETSSEDVRHEIPCDNNMKNIHFSIYFFKTEMIKNEFLEEDRKRKLYFQNNFGSYYNPKHDRSLTRSCPELYNPCFKRGSHYVVCENVRWNRKTGIPLFNGAPYYHEFKGTDMDWKIP